MADDSQQPVFQIQRVYLKDASLEQPNSPAILTSQEQPSVDIQLGVGVENVAEGITDPRAIVERVYADVPTSVWPAAGMTVRAQLAYLS